MPYGPYSYSCQKPLSGKELMRADRRRRKLERRAKRLGVSAFDLMTEKLLEQK